MNNPCFLRPSFLFKKNLQKREKLNVMDERNEWQQRFARTMASLTGEGVYMADVANDETN